MPLSDAFNRSFDRRTMLRRSAATAAFAAGMSTLGPLLAAPKPGLQDRRLRLVFGKGKRSSPEAVDIARQIGVDGIQINMGTAGNGMHLREPAVQKAYREAALRTGLEIASIALGELNEVPLKAICARGVALRLHRLVVRPCICRSSGTDVYKGDLDMKRTAEIDRVVNVLRDAAAKAEKRSVLIGLENYLTPKTTRRSSTAWARPPCGSTMTLATRPTRGAT